MLPPSADEALFSRRGLYGGFGGFERDGLAKAVYSRSQRQRINIVSVGQCLFVPWLFFCLVYALMSFSIHFKNPALCYALIGSCLSIVLLTGGLALRAMLRRMKGEPREPSWIVFVSLTMLIAWTLGVLFGHLNFWMNLHPYYEYKSLNAYSHVDLAKASGQQFMDAGRIYFSENAQLDIRRSMGFKNMDTYCVAPIALKQEGTLLPLETYDFWAVGLDCCSPNTNDFHCGEYQATGPMSGLRLLTDSQRPFFRLAVQQAQAAYAIQAKHPLFFYWARDAGAEMESFRTEGYKYFMIGMLAHFGWQTLAVGLAVLGFARLGHY
jgi:hypothetical protein